MLQEKLDESLILKAKKYFKSHKLFIASTL